MEKAADEETGTAAAGKSQIACHQSTAHWSVQSAERCGRLAARVEPGWAEEGGGCLLGLGEMLKGWPILLLHTDRRLEEKAAGDGGTGQGGPGRRLQLRS